MATKKRLIDTNVLMEDSIWKCGGDPFDPYYMGYQDALDNIDVTIENQPTVDAVEVVRCKDCVWYKPNYLPGLQKMMIAEYVIVIRF